jgi:hypothetical protein
VRKNAGLELVMMDFVFVLATVLFFGAAILYVRGCERLK